MLRHAEAAGLRRSNVKFFLCWGTVQNTPDCWLQGRTTRPGSVYPYGAALMLIAYYHEFLFTPGTVGLTAR